MEYQIELAKLQDAQAVFELYHSLIDMPYSTWDEEYPTLDIVKDDLAKNVVLIMRGEEGRIFAAIAVAEEDEDFDGAAQWYADVTRWVALSRLGVDKSMQGRGIAKAMLLAAMAYAKDKGYEAVRFLVSKENPYPQRAYAKLNFNICGETLLYEHRWLCYQKRL